MRRRITYEKVKELEAEQRAPFQPFTIDLSGPPTEDAQLAIRALMRKAKAARGDLALFYQMVMRHELTGVPLIPAPHQCLSFSFDCSARFANDGRDPRDRATKPSWSNPPRPGRASGPRSSSDATVRQPPAREQRASW